MADLSSVPGWLTADWLSGVLDGDVRIGSVRRIGDGLVGMNLRIGIETGRDDLPTSVVVKLPSPDPTSRATGVAMRNYEREVRFYREVAPTVDIRVARCWHADWDPATGDFVLVLEDLAPAAQGDQVRGCSVEQARDAVVELAALHGPRWDDPTLDDLDWLGRRTGPEDGERLREMWQVLLPGFLATYGPSLGTDGVDLVHAFGDRLVSWVDGRMPPYTVTHGDYRLDNLMFASEAGGPRVAAVDWQTPGHGPAAADVSYFLGAGLLPDVRLAVERDLLDDYRAAIAHYGVDLDPVWWWDQYRREAFAGLVMSVIASQIVGASERSVAMFTAMATRHVRHALDLGSLDLL